MLQRKKITEINRIFKLFPQIKLVYLFGSRASGHAGPLSDFDFAVYLQENNKLKRFKIKLQLIAKLNKLLKNNSIDVVILNDATSPELKYNILTGGKLIYSRIPFKILVEPRILNEYFDFRQSLSMYGLTKA